ncbi:MAG: DUF790 family protein [Theionarchaea archaeon]|nr:DUF790 family protein [Theionarchaea archaeon]
MFSRELLVVRKRKPYITPVYIKPDDHALAEMVIDLYRPGKSRGEMEAEIRELETHATYRQIRGFSELMRRRTHFEAEYPVDPRLVRQVLWEKGAVTDEEQRTLRMHKAAQGLGVSVEELDRVFWADQDEFQIAIQVDDITPVQLIQQYNLSLTQTLLFDALSLEISTDDAIQDIFRMIKFLGLMYEILPTEKEEAYVVRVTGPVALFHKTKKYGTALARLVPQILKATSWNIQAQIETQVAGEPRIYIFELSHRKTDYFPQRTAPAHTFDSSIEEDFQTRLSALRKDWIIKREPTVIKAGPWAMIPDFSVERRNKKCLIEIVGFWTPQYLQKKIEKINAVQEDIVLLVDKKLQCTVKDFQKDSVDIIYYDKTIPMKPIIERLKKMEDEQLAEDVKKLATIPFCVEEEGKGKAERVTIALQDIATRHGVGIEAVEKMLASHPAGRVVGSKFIKTPLLEKIHQVIGDQEDNRLTAVREVLHEYGLEEDALPALGFHIKWRSLDPRDARVVEKVPHSDSVE